MAKIQIEIPTELNKKILIYKTKKDHKNKQEAIIEILENSFQEDEQRRK